LRLGSEIYAIAACNIVFGERLIIKTAEEQGAGSRGKEVFLVFA
jgi:hypothetical protein